LVRVRVRQHVNPLSQQYQKSVTPPDWHQVYGDLSQPLHLDIGCGWGRFLLNMATIVPDWNYLGLEIREPVVNEAIANRDEAELKNLHYIFCNVNYSLRDLLASLPLGTLQRVSIQFPDPWFKKRHQKRRVVQPNLVETIAKYLASDGQVFLQSDVKEVAEEMRDRFLEHPSFALKYPHWLESNPLPVSTERELSTIKHQDPVFRCLLRKTIS
jgi:tRNA (guanine-N7-)-methyltransferase